MTQRPAESMLTWAEVMAFVRVVLRWWPICVLAVALAGGTAYYLSLGEKPYYVARTTLMVGNTLSSARPDQYQISISSSLARFYAELARRGRILQPVQEQLQLPFSWELIAERMLSTEVVATANMIEIYVTDTDPQRAAAISEAIGEQLVNYSPTSPEKIQAERAAVEQQLADSQARIDSFKLKIEELSQRQREATSASDLVEINQTLAELNSTLNNEQAAYSSLLGYKNSSEVNSLSFFEHAVAPSQPLPSKRLVVVGAAGLGGLLLSLIAVFLLDQIDNRLRRTDTVKERAKIGELGQVPSGPPLLIAAQEYAVERLRAVRDVQTNIMLASGGIRTLVVTSPEASESRTAFSVDLADLFGRAGHRVLLVDADHAGSQLSRILAADSTAQVWPSMASKTQSSLWAHFQPTRLQNVALLPRRQAGDAPALISSERWRELVGHLSDAADVVIFDGPDTLSGPDAALLAPHVDGVVLTVEPGANSRDEVVKSRERLLTQEGAHLLGAVVFQPSGDAARSGWRWLRDGGPRRLTDSQAAAPAPEAGPAAHEPIVTPPPAADSGRVIVTPAAAAAPPLLAPGPDAETPPTEPPNQPAAPKARSRRRAPVQRAVEGELVTDDSLPAVEPAAPERERSVGEPLAADPPPRPRRSSSRRQSRPE